MTTKSKSSSPSHTVYVVEGEGDRAFWTKVGSAWFHDDGEGFNIRLTALPIDGRLIIRKAKAKSDQEMGR
ncbi:hypothetical protein [Aurantimonas sp. VKM B-3413]|uniref:hypothetical protein n=1 Tax=Aurantimonas sp. VKM B-3413 TaxID=2779401 RepID=UPI001E2FE90B|nr:hypothetical protein [Aurantimonas sp. VKM B-3413]MCB8835821.1 hypothetical protein [Aurantimonas sp. VKM B-3413]